MYTAIIIIFLNDIVPNIYSVILMIIEFAVTLNHISIFVYNLIHFSYLYQH